MTFAFEREGCRVTSSGAATTIDDLVRTDAPDVLVVSTRGRVTDAAAVAEEVKRVTATRRVPAVVLGEPGLREAVTAVEDFDFLPLPVFVRDVITAARLRLALGTAPTDASTERAVYGTLSEYGSFFLIRTLLGLRRSAIVQLERGNRRGEIRLSEGELVGATVTGGGSGALQGLSALHHLLLWEEAALDLRLRAVARRGSLGASGPVLEGAERFLRDFAHAAHQLGTAQDVFQPTADAPARRDDEVPAEAVPLLRLLDGRRSLADVLEESPFRVFDSLRILLRLQEAGLIHRTGRAPGGGAATGTRKPVLEAWLGGSSTPSEAPEPMVTTLSTAESLASGEAPASSQPSVGSPPQVNEQSTGAEVPNVEPSAPAYVRPLDLPGEPTPPPSPVVVPPPAPPLAVAPPEEAAPVMPGPPAAQVHGEIRARRASGTEPRPRTPSVVVTLPVEPVFVAPEPPAPVTPPVAAPVSTELKPMVVAAAPTSRSRKPSGSIELDPALLAEMDAFELANTPPTPPPVVESAAVQPPAAVQPLASTPRRPTPSPDVVSSFVRLQPGRVVTPLAVPSRRSLAGTPLSFASAPAAPAAAPLTVTADVPRFATEVPSEPAAPTPATVVPDAPSADAPPHVAAIAPGLAPPALETTPDDSASKPAFANGHPAMSAETAPPRQDVTPPPFAAPPAPAADSRPRRSASAEFSALESDFFAREADLYQGDDPDLRLDDDRDRRKS